MGRPVAEIERTARASLERIATLGDMPQMQHGGALDAGFQRRRLQCGQGLKIRLDPLEELPVLHQGHLHRLDQTGAAGFLRLAVEESEIIDHRERHGEGTDPVLFAERIDRALHPHPAVVLGQCGGGKPDQAHAAVGGGGREPRRIEQRAAADHEHVGMAVEVGIRDELPNLAHPVIPRLGAFATGQDVHAGQFHRQVGKIAADVIFQGRPGGSHRVLQQHQCAPASTLSQQSGQLTVGRGKSPARENHAVLVDDGDAEIVA